LIQIYFVYTTEERSPESLDYGWLGFLGIFFIEVDAVVPKILDFC
jgi:hypothetical protein